MRERGRAISIGALAMCVYIVGLPLCANDFDGASRATPTVKRPRADIEDYRNDFDAPNNFVWADLSTYNTRVASGFYSYLFDWNYAQYEGYFTAFIEEESVSGLYEMPAEYQRASLPSFWMSYIQVDDVDETMRAARSLGGSIEFTDFTNQNGRVALIRDPAGAGFTVIERGQTDGVRTEAPGTVVWNALYIDDAEKVLTFYRELLGWDIARTDINQYTVRNRQQHPIASIEQVSNAAKGPYTYWGVFFAVLDIEEAIDEAENRGGTLVARQGDTALIQDPLGAAFYIRQ